MTSTSIYQNNPPEKSKYSNKGNTGLTCYNDGIRNYMIKVADIPDPSWYKGRLLKPSNKVWYNDGNKSFKLSPGDFIDPSWYKGKLGNKGNIGYKWYNDSINNFNVRPGDFIDPSWSKGVTDEYKLKLKKKPLPEKIDIFHNISLSISHPIIKLLFFKSNDHIDSSKLQQSWYQSNSYWNGHKRIDLKYIFDFVISILDDYPEKYTTTEKFYLWYNQCEVKLCKICKKEYTLVNSNYCSAYCGQRDIELKLISTKKIDYSAVQQKREATMKKKYGFAYNSQRPDVKKILSISKLSDEINNKLNDYDWMNYNYVIQKRTSVDIANELGCYYGTVCEKLRGHDINVTGRNLVSDLEKDVTSWLSSLDLTFETSNRKILNPKEIDIYFPDKKVGIEMNGLFWHSLNSNNDTQFKFKHMQKFLLAEEAGVKLLQFTDYQWKNKQNIVKSMILNSIGVISRKLNGRATQIKEISNIEYVNFCELNHIDGSARASIRYGLYFKDELVSVIGFNRSRFHKNYDFEIIRFCSILGSNVRGGFSKLLKHFTRLNEGKSICSYSNNSIGNGTLYEKNGFTLIKTTSPGYVWTNGKEILSRYQTQKKNLSLILNDKYDSKLSEVANMTNAKWNQYWDCGNKFWGLI